MLFTAPNKFSLKPFVETTFKVGLESNRWEANGNSSNSPTNHILDISRMPLYLNACRAAPVLQTNWMHYYFILKGLGTQHICLEPQHFPPFGHSVTSLITHIKLSVRLTICHIVRPQNKKKRLAFHIPPDTSERRCAPWSEVFWYVFWKTFVVLNASINHSNKSPF